MKSTDMEPLRIVFMGTPEFAVATLDNLVKNEYNVVGVITAPDKPAGRGRKLQVSAIKQYALDHGLKVLQPNNLKDGSFLEELKSLDANLQIVVAFRMLPKAVWQIPKYGTFNLHASLLPNYRGAAPINWAIINGETETGATTFYIDDKIDTGEIILQQKINILPDETVGRHSLANIWGAYAKIREIHTLEIGRLVHDKKSIKVAVQGGFIELKEIQLPGKRKMKVHELLNGISLSESAHVR